MGSTPLYKGRFRRICVRIWRDQKFRQLDDQTKLLFLRLLTDPDLTSFGALAVSFSGLGESLGWTGKQVSIRVSILASNGLAEGDDSAGLIVLWNYVRYNPPANFKQIKGWEVAADELPECDLLSRYLARVSEIVEGQNGAREIPVPVPFRNHRDTGLDTGMDTGIDRGIRSRARAETETETEKDTSPSGSVGPELPEPRHSGPAVPAELAELELYAADPKLCKEWPQFYPQALTTYPGVDVLGLVRRLHLWELTHPARRKKNRVAFFNNRLNVEQDKPRREAQIHGGDYSDLLNRPAAGEEPDGK